MVPFLLSFLLAGDEAGPQSVVGSPAFAYVGAVLAHSGIAASPFVARLVGRIFPGRNVFFARWGFTHLARVVLAFAAAVVVPHYLWPRSTGASLSEDLLRSALVFGAAGAAAIHFAHRLSPEGARALGFRRGRNARAVVAGVAAYLLLAPGIFGLGFLWPWVVERLGGVWEVQAPVKGFLALSGPRLWLAVVLAVGVMPFLEELLFRGFLQPLLVQNFRDQGGIALTSLFFAALHGWDAFLPIFGLSLLLGGIMLRTQRLVACWAVHGLHNALTIAVLLGSEEVRGMLPREAFLPLR